MNSDTIATIKDFLYVERARLQERAELWADDSDQQKRCQREIDTIDAALAELNALEQPQPAMPAPVGALYTLLDYAENTAAPLGAMQAARDVRNWLQQRPAAQE